MTVNELIQQLQDSPDSLKNCDIIMRQYDCCYKYAVIVDSIYVEVSGTDNVLYEDIAFKEAGKMDGYKSVVLA